jgi:hypothetical protein
MFLKWYSPKILFKYNKEDENIGVQRLCLRELPAELHSIIKLKLYVTIQEQEQKLGFQLNPLRSSEIPVTQINRVLQSKLKSNKPSCYANWYENFIKRLFLIVANKKSNIPLTL